MSSRRLRGTLPIRRWLVLALVCTFLIPVGITGFAVYHLGLGGDPFSNMDDAAEMLRENSSRWDEPAWQAATRDELAAQGFEFVLLNGEQEIYRSAADPLGSADDDGDSESLVRRVSVPDGASDQIAYIYASSSAAQNDWPPAEQGNALIPLIPLTALLATLGGIGWLLGRTVVRPLAATNRAAQQVAGGDLDVALPSSRVREVAELNATFETMSAELRNSLQERARLEQERRLFISAVAHDLRTPLFSLRGSLQGLEQGVADTPEKRERYVAIAQERAGALERLIADLFDFTRLEYLDQEPAWEEFALDDLLRQLVDDLQPRAEAEGIAVELDAPPEPCVVAGDRHLLSRVVGNLLDNALWFTPEGGRIRVECDAGPDAATFSVTDTGPGIPSEDLPHLFTPLFRGEASRNRQTGGAGLGLTIARRIMQAHGGDLEAGNADSGGAVFTGTLPSHDDHHGSEEKWQSNTN